MSDTEENNIEGKDAFNSIMGLKHRKSYLINLLDINPRSWYDLEEKGVIPLEGTYGEVLRLVFKHFQLRNDAALEKAKLRASNDTESGMSKVMEASMIQKIRLDTAREKSIHINNMKEQKMLLDKNEMVSLIMPIFGSVVSVLRGLSDSRPEIQPEIDKCFERLHHTGRKILEQCDFDSESYVDEMMNAEVDLDSLLGGEY